MADRKLFTAASNNGAAKSEAEILRKISEFHEKLPRDKYFSCNRPGTLPNPIKVSIRSHEKRAAIFRYIVLWAVEKGTNTFLMRGNRVQTNLDGMEGFGVPDPVNLSAGERAQMSAVTLAIAGQVNDGEWFYLAGSPTTLYFLDRREVVFPFDEALNSHRLCITKIHDTDSGKTRTISKTMTEVISDALAEAARWDQAYRDGRAI